MRLTYDPLALETKVLDGNGGEWRYQYLPNGRVVFLTDPYGGVRHWRVSPDGRVLAEVDEKSAETTYRFDEAGAPVAKVTPKGDVLSLPRDDDEPLEREHRVPGRPIEWDLGDLWDLDFRLPDAHELPFDVPAEARTELVTSETYQRGTLEAVHDEQGLELKEQAEDGRARTFGYDPNGVLRRLTDLDGGTYRYEIGSWNQLARETDPAGRVVSYEWSATNELVAVVDQAGVRTEYLRDLKDRIVEVRRGGAIHERYVYDAAGNVIERRDASGEVLLALTYDRRGCVLERKLASGEEHAYRRDARGRPIAARTLRHECTFAYDALDHRIEDKRDGKGVEHRYRGAKLVETRVIERFTTHYHHFANGGLVVVDPTGTTHRIRAHGRGVYTRDLGNGVSETTQYHPRGGRVLSRTVWTKEGVRCQRVYRYSGEGDLLEVADSERGTTRHEHDAAHRLAATRHPDGRVDHYEYNAAGSLFRSPTLQGTVGQLNQLRHANGDQLEYDHRHHIESRVGARGVMHFDRDSRDQLVGVFWESADGTQRFGWDAEYDPFGRRICKRPGYRDEHVFYWDTDRLIAEILPSGRLRAYVYADGFAMTPMLFVDYESVDADPASGTRYYVLADQRGCPERILDDAGETVWRAAIDAYGTARVEVGADFHQPLRFPGHYFDAELALCCNRFRYYSPELGRYMESDPIGQAGGLNVYAYTRNPLTQVDVRGLDPCDGTRRRAPEDEEPHARQDGCALPHRPSDAEATRPDPRAARAAEEGLEYDPSRANPSPELNAAMTAARAKTRAAQARHAEQPRSRQGKTVAVNGGTHLSGYNTDASPNPPAGFTNGPGRNPETATAYDRSIGHEPHANSSLDPRRSVDESGNTRTTGPNGDGETIPGGSSATHAERQSGLAQNANGTNDPTGVSRGQCRDCREQQRQHAQNPNRPGANDPVVVGDPHYTRVYNPDGSVDIFTPTHDGGHEYVGTSPSGSDPRAGYMNNTDVPW